MINFFAPINYLGYGIHSYNLIKEYSKIVGSENIVLQPPFGTTQFVDDDVVQWLENQPKFSSKNPSIMIFHEHFLPHFSGTPRIGLPVFECEVFSATEVAALRDVDRLFVVSRWAQQVLKNYHLESVVIPEGFNPSLFFPKYPVAYKRLRMGKRGVHFVHVGKWEERKSSVDILKVFALLSEKVKRPVTLMAHMCNPFMQWMKEVGKVLDELGFTVGKVEPHLPAFRAHRASVTIVVPQGPFAQPSQVAELYHDADFGIWLSRAEGWNLPLMECLACGTPPITTTWTGMSEYLDGASSYLRQQLFIREGVVEQAPHPFKGTWKRAVVDHVVEVVADVVEHAEERVELTDYAVDSTTGFLWRHAAEKLHQALERR